MKMKTTEIGRLGETEVCRRLEQLGYSIVKRNFCIRGGEIDIIARNREYLTFVEVKLRKSDAFGEAREFVDARKQERIRATAALWLETHETALQPRFDVVEVYAPDGMHTKTPEIRLIEDAF